MELQYCELRCNWSPSDSYFASSCRYISPMGPLKIVLLTDTDSLNQNGALPYKYYGQKLWTTVRTLVEELHHRCESVELHKLDFQEHESVNKYLNADIVIMVTEMNDWGSVEPFYRLGCHQPRPTTDLHVSQRQSRERGLSRRHCLDSSEWR
jgi:hypothetical protein